METKIKETTRDEVIAFARKSHESFERVHYGDFDRFSALYTDTYRIMRGKEPFSITIRRTYNRYCVTAVHDREVDIFAGVLILGFACDLDPSFNYLDVELRP